MAWRSMRADRSSGAIARFDRVSPTDAVLPTQRERDGALLRLKRPGAIVLSFPDLITRNDEHTVLRQKLYDRRARLRQVPVLLLCLGLTAYFAYHTVKGRHGLEARDMYLERESALEFEIQSLEAVRAKLERDVALLRPDLPDPDFVEEVAREVLGFAHPDDRIVADEGPLG